MLYETHFLVIAGFFWTQTRLVTSNGWILEF